MNQPALAFSASVRTFKTLALLPATSAAATATKTPTVVKSFLPKELFFLGATSTGAGLFSAGLANAPGRSRKPEPSGFAAAAAFHPCC